MIAGGVVFGERSISVEKENEEDLQIDTSSSPESDAFSQSECTEVVPGLPQPHHNLLDDPLLQLSPRVLIPQKKVSVFQSKQQARQADVALNEETNVSLKKNSIYFLMVFKIIDKSKCKNMIWWFYIL